MLQFISVLALLILTAAIRRTPRYSARHDDGLRCGR
jgi:hypothetical protein